MNTSVFNTKKREGARRKHLPAVAEDIDGCPDVPVEGIAWTDREVVTCGLKIDRAPVWPTCVPGIRTGARL